MTMPPLPLPIIEAVEEVVVFVSEVFVLATDFLGAGGGGSNWQLSANACLSSSSGIDPNQ